MRRLLTPAMGVLCAMAFMAAGTLGVAASPPISQPAPGSPVFASFLAAFDNQGTTLLVANATSSDGSPLAYVWSVQNMSCGALVQPQQRGNQNGYFHGPTKQDPEGCPFAVESQTRVTVLVARAADLDAGGTPHDNAPYFIYSQVARAHDSGQTSDLDPAPSLRYFGVAAAGGNGGGNPSGQPSPPAPQSPATVSTGGFPTGVIIGVVVVTAAGTFAWFVLRRRPEGQVDLVHPYAEVDPGLPPPPPPQHHVVTPPPPPTTPPPPQHVDEDTGGGTDATGTAPDDDYTDTDIPPPEIFAPRLPVETLVEQPQLPPYEVFTPPPPPPPAIVPVQPPPQQSTQRQHLPKHCGPQVDDVFAAALDRVCRRLRTIFGTEPSSVWGYAFLAANGWELDFWVLNPATDCPGPHCTGTTTLCGRCYPQHILSDIMYGFVGGYFGVAGEAIGAAGVAYQLTKWLSSDEIKQPVSPQHVTEAQPAYQLGVRLGGKFRDPQHAGRWNVTKEDVCSEIGTMNMHAMLTQLLLQQHASSTSGCPPATCVVTAPDTDWSRKAWHWDEPLDVQHRWAVTGKGL